MAHVLGALEDTERERGQEVTSGQQSGGWSQREAGVFAQEIAHLLQLWDAVIDEDLLLLQFVENGDILGTGVLLHQLLDAAEHRRPGLVLDVGVVDVWDWVTAGWIVEGVSVV